MKNKIFVFIGITILFSCFFTVKAHAQTLNQLSANSKYMVYYRFTTDTPGIYRYYIYTVPESINHNEVSLNIDNNNIYGLPNNSPYSWITKYWVRDEDPLLDLTKDFTIRTSDTQRSFSYSSSDLIIVLKGDINISTSNSNVFGSLNDYNESIAPTWWERVAQIFTDFATSPAMGAVLSGDWLGYINEVLFGELWVVQVGEGEDELAQFYTVSATPSPSPTPIPTQIPVQVNIDPTTGNVIYHYTIDVSGTPVPTSSPVNPNPPAGTGGYGSELTEPFGVTDYYEPDDSLSIPNLRIFQFQLDLPGSNTDIGVDSLDNNVEVMNGYLEDNADAITTVSSFFQVIPSDWFLLLGAIACFPIIAAMIKSLLGG